MDIATPSPDDLRLPGPARGAAFDPASAAPLLREPVLAAELKACGLSSEEFCAALQRIGHKVNCGLPPTAPPPTPSQQTAFFQALRLPELALAQACALGREAAWVRLVAQFRGPVTAAAIGIAGSATVGHELADSLWAELYGIRSNAAAERRSPLLSYTGRGSLLGWLRASLAQRFVDHHRRTRREAPLDDSAEAAVAAAAPSPAAHALSPTLLRVGSALRRSFAELSAEDRAMLAFYFLDRRTLAEIARMLRVHEATISRRLKRLTGDLRGHLLHHLEAGGLSRRAAEEALGTDPRDVEINLRALLQSSRAAPFSDQANTSAPVALGPSA